MRVCARADPRDCAKVTIVHVKLVSFYLLALLLLSQQSKAKRSRTWAHENALRKQSWSSETSRKSGTKSQTKHTQTEWSCQDTNTWGLRVKLPTRGFWLAANRKGKCPRVIPVRAIAKMGSNSSLRGATYSGCWLLAAQLLPRLLQVVKVSPRATSIYWARTADQNSAGPTLAYI